MDGIEICPHTPDEECQCRKPLPGMVVQAAERLGFDPAQAVMVGDKEVDVGLGHAVGAVSILVRTGYGRTYESATAADHVVDDLAAAVDMILSSV